MNDLSKTLRNRDLIAHACWIDGEWTAQTENSFNIENPADGQILGSLPECGREECLKAVQAADRAFRGWKSLLGKERADLIFKWHDLILANKEDLAKIITLENGKPFAESQNEIAYAASFLRWFAEEARRTRGDVIPPARPNTSAFTIMQPAGVAGAITPWNFPAAMITRKVAPALAAGCTAVIKPSELTPYSCIALMKLAEKAGLPRGVLNAVFGDARAIGETLCESPSVRKITFTGSTRVGKLLMSQAAPTVKKVTLELGGNAPFIVFEDADVEQAVDEAMLCKFRNAGQTCVCANRIYVHDAVYDSFARLLVEKAKKLKVGNGMEHGVEIGPLISLAGLEKAARHVRDAEAKGGRVLLGGKPHAAGGNFFEPTVIADAAEGSELCAEETFGPVAALFRFNDEEDALRQANDSEAGLAGYFFTKDLSRAMRVARELEVGIVGVNTGIISTESAPFGGVKESGLGREGSHLGIDEFMEVKYVLINEV